MLVKNGWELPCDPLGKTEMVEEMSLHEDIPAAQRLALADTSKQDVPCRKVRVGSTLR